MVLTWEKVERYRDRTFRRRPSLAVKGTRSALAFIQQVGFCTAFSVHPHLACLWVAASGERRPRMPHHTHSDPVLGLTWDLKDRLPDARQVFYARLLCGKPSLISLEFLPSFYRLFGTPTEGLPHSGLGLVEQGILDWLSTRPPQPTYQLRLHGDFRGPLSKPRYEKAIGRLQEKLLVLKTRTVYEPKFTYYWGLVEKTFPKEVRKAGRLSRQGALRKILQRYFDTALCARRRDLLSIFRGLDAAELDAALEAMAGKGILQKGRRFHGLEGLWFSRNVI